jgi:glucan 1,3-beta-glucosidase
MQPQARFNDGYPPSPSFRDSAALDKSEAGRDTPNAPFIGSQGNDGAYTPTYGTKAAEAAKRKKIVISIVAVTVVALILAIILPIYFLVVKPKNQSFVASGGSGGSTSGGGGGGGGSTTPGKPNSKVTGGDGSEVTMEDGTKFTYNNKFGGYWYYDPQDPLNNSARPQADIPALNATWKFGTDVIQGVNIGGWLVTEPFITPALYQKYPGSTDEWSLSLAMRADTAGGGINQLEDHYKTFFTEKDFAEIAGAGLNWVRLPIPYWAIETWDGEPFLEGVAWKYALKAFGWARKYGLRINLDLHAVPGSQNPWWHSGRVGANPNMLYGPMGYANAQRTLDYIRIITEFISQDEYKDVIPLFGVLNEPLVQTLTRPEVERFYYQAHQIVRGVTGLGAGKGPYISFHDGFDGVEQWYGFLPGADRMALDHHPYFAFSGGSNAPFESFINMACDSWAAQTNTSMTSFGMTSAGEWSLAWNDCGLYVNGVTGTVTYPGDCAPWNDYTTWTPEIKNNMRLFALNQMSALQNQFFWTWKIAPPSGTDIVGAPLWSYKLGLDNGWMPKSPRDAYGVCGAANPFTADKFLPWQTGGAGAGQFTGSVAAYQNWPPATAQFLFTPNRPIPKLPSDGSFPKGIGGDGWTNDADTTQSMGPNPGCTYPNPYNEGPSTPGVAACLPGLA